MTRVVPPSTGAIWPSTRSRPPASAPPRMRVSALSISWRGSPATSSNSGRLACSASRMRQLRAGPIRASGAGSRRRSRQMPAPLRRRRAARRVATGAAPAYADGCGANSPCSRLIAGSRHELLRKKRQRVALAFVIARDAVSAGSRRGAWRKSNTSSAAGAQSREPLPPGPAVSQTQACAGAPAQQRAFVSISRLARSSLTGKRQRFRDHRVGADAMRGKRVDPAAQGRARDDRDRNRAPQRCVRAARNAGPRPDWPADPRVRTARPWPVARAASTPLAYPAAALARTAPAPRCAARAPWFPAAARRHSLPTAHGPAHPARARSSCPSACSRISRRSDMIRSKLPREIGADCSSSSAEPVQSLGMQSSAPRLRSITRMPPSAPLPRLRSIRLKNVNGRPSRVMSPRARKYVLLHVVAARMHRRRATVDRSPGSSVLRIAQRSG